MNISRWQLLARTLFTALAAGLDIGSRSDFTWSDDKLTLTFQTRESFASFTRRVFRHDASRSVDFEIDIESPSRVLCRLTMNLTPKLRVLSSSDPTPDVEDSDVVIYY